MRRIILAAFLLSSTPALAEDTARDHFGRGAVLYEATRYAAALHEFEVAQSLQPMPALIYDIAKCLDKLGRGKDALAAYTRYLDESPEAENADEVKARVEELRTVPVPVAPASPVVAELTMKPAVPTPVRRRYLLPGVVGGAAVALAAVGAGLLGSTASDYRALDGSCAPRCPASSWSSLPAREHAGEALLGIAAAVAVVDVVLWVREARRK